MTARGGIEAKVLEAGIEMITDEDVKRAVLHEAGHAAAYFVLNQHSEGIAVRKEGLKFCNLVAPDSPQMGDAGGSAAELLLLGNYDKSAAGADRTKLSLSEDEFDELVKHTVPLLLPHKRRIRRIASRLVDRVMPPIRNRDAMQVRTLPGAST